MLLWIEGFETFGTAAAQWAQVATKYYTDPTYYSGGSYYKLRDGRWGGYSLELWDNNIYITTLPLPTTDPTMVVGFNFYNTVIVDGNYNGPSVAFWDDTAMRLAVILTITGELSVYRGSTLLGTTTGAGISAAQWHHIEIKVYCHATAGTVTIRVDEVEKLALTSQNTRNSGDARFNRVRFRGITNTTNSRFDDVYILDATSTVNNNFLGRKRVIAIFPNAAGDLTQWTASTGTNWDCVDEQNPSTTDYVQADTSGLTDLYNFSAVSGITGGVCGVQINVLAISTQDGAPWNVYLPVKPQSGSENDGSAILVVSSTHKIKSRLLETNPTTGVAWTTADLDSAQFGLKLV
jgi:hypothetical protein